MQTVSKVIFSLTFFLVSSLASAQIIADVELNILQTGYNNIQVSGTEGTRFNAADFDNNLSAAYRIRFGYRFGDRHNVFALFAPLTVSYEGEFDQPTRFQNALFLPATNTTVNYTFNSYRLTYRYDFVVTDKVRLGAGLTGKIRDAAIVVEQDNAVGTTSDETTNVGFVPLINLYAVAQVSDKVGFLLNGDGLASPQGRAFDFELASFYNITPEAKVRLGYRILEGGADNDEVYNFSLVNYGLLGFSYNF